MSGGGGTVQRICPACAALTSQVVDPSCPYCLGQGTITLGAGVLHLYEPPVVAEAVRLALTLAESEAAMTILADTGVIKRPDLEAQWRARPAGGTGTQPAAPQQVAPPAAQRPTPPVQPTEALPEPGAMTHQGLLAKPLLTTQEVADILGLEVRTIENWRYKEEGPPAVKIGRAVRYRGETIREWINNLHQA